MKADLTRTEGLLVEENGRLGSEIAETKNAAMHQITELSNHVVAIQVGDRFSVVIVVVLLVLGRWWCCDLLLFNTPTHNIPMTSPLVTPLSQHTLSLMQKNIILDDHPCVF